MVAIKSAMATRFVESPDPKLSLFLVYGNDAGMVSERSQKLARAIADRESPPGEILRFGDTDLEDEPDRLANELQTIPMFGGRKIVRATTGRRINVNTLKPLVQGGPLAGVLVVEAGSLKPEEALRALFEKSPSAAAIACYSDETRDLAAVIDETLQASGLAITLDARELLVSRLGADRVMTRSEIDKLVLYAHGRKTIEAEDVEAIVGDASEQALDRAALAAASGDTARAVVECDRAVSSGEGAQAVIAAVQRHFMRLHRTRVLVDQGRSLDDALRSLKPQVHFRQKDQFAAQLRMWNLPRLVRALHGIAVAAKSARRSSALDQPLAERLLMDLSRLARTSAPEGTRRH